MQDGSRRDGGELAVHGGVGWSRSGTVVSPKWVNAGVRTLAANRFFNPSMGTGRILRSSPVVPDLSKVSLLAERCGKS